MNNWCLTKTIASIAIFISVLFYGCSSNIQPSVPTDSSPKAEQDVQVGVNTPETTAKEQYIPVDAKDVSSAYADNRIAADQVYKDKLLEVSGVIDDFGSDDSVGVLYIVLETDNNNDLLCIFSKDDIDVLASLKKGNLVTLRGKCEGKDFMNDIIAVDKIHISECTVVSTNTETETGKPNDTGNNSGIFVADLLDMSFSQIYDLMPKAFEGEITFEEISKIDGEMTIIHLWVEVDGIPTIDFTTYNADGTNDERYVSSIVVLNPKMGIPLNDNLKSDATIADIEKLAATTDLQIDINKPEEDFMTYAYISYGMDEYAMRFSYTYNSYAMEVELFTGRF